MGFPGESDGKESLPAMQEMRVRSLRSRQSPGGGHGNPLQYSGLENPMDTGAWRATVHGVAKSRTRLSNFHFHTRNSHRSRRKINMLNFALFHDFIQASSILINLRSWIPRLSFFSNWSHCLYRLVQAASRIAKMHESRIADDTISNHLRGKMSFVWCDDHFAMWGNFFSNFMFTFCFIC